MTDPKQDQRIQIVASADFVDAIDDWRRRQPRLVSRSEAIRRLVELGLQTAPTEKAPADGQ